MAKIRNNNTKAGPPRGSSIRLEVQNEHLRNKLAEMTEKNEQLLEQVECLNEAIATLQKALTAREKGRVCLTETYSGEVVHLEDDEVVVAYQMDDDIVEHTYVASQFIKGGTPSTGESVEVFVSVAVKPPEDADEAENINFQPRKRKNVVSGPEEF